MLELFTVLAVVEAEESSQTAFYVAGGVLAAWAVLVSLAGMRGTVPRTARAARAVMAISAVLVAATCAAAVVTG